MADQQAQAGADADDQGQSLAAMATQADQDQQAKDAAAKAADAKPGDAGADDQQDDAGQDDPLQIAKFYDEVHGRRDAEKFKNDMEWLQHVDQMQQLLGQRNEDAVLGKKLREQLDGREIDVAAMLAGQAKPAEAADGAPEWNPAWLSVGEDGKLQPALGAPKDVLERYARYSQWAQGRLHSMLTEPEKFLETATAKRFKDLEDQTKATKTEMAEQEARTQVEALCSQHCNLLYVGGDPEQGMTAVGNEILAEVNDAVEEAKRANKDRAAVAAQGQAVLKRSLRLASKIQPKNKPGKPASKRAARQPSMAATSGRSDEETDKIMASRGGLSRILQERYEAQKAAAATS